MKRLELISCSHTSLINPPPPGPPAPHHHHHHRDISIRAGIQQPNINWQIHAIFDVLTYAESQPGIMESYSDQIKSFRNYSSFAASEWKSPSGPPPSRLQGNMQRVCVCVCVRVRACVHVSAVMVFLRQQSNTTGPAYARPGCQSASQQLPGLGPSHNN